MDPLIDNRRVQGVALLTTIALSWQMSYLVTLGASPGVGLIATGHESDADNNQIDLAFTRFNVCKNGNGCTFMTPDCAQTNPGDLCVMDYTSLEKKTDGTLADKYEIIPNDVKVNIEHAAGRDSIRADTRYYLYTVLTTFLMLVVSWRVSLNVENDNDDRGNPKPGFHRVDLANVLYVVSIFVLGFMNFSHDNPHPDGWNAAFGGPMFTYGMLIVGTAFVHRIKKIQLQANVGNYSAWSANLRLALGILLLGAGFVMCMTASGKPATVVALLFSLIVLFTIVCVLHAYAGERNVFMLKKFPWVMWIACWALMLIFTVLNGIKFDDLNTSDSVSVVGNLGYLWAYYAGGVVGLFFAFLTLLSQLCARTPTFVDPALRLVNLDNRDNVNVRPTSRASLVRNSLNFV